MKVLLLVLGGVLLLLALAALIGYLYMKRYLERSQEGVRDTMSEIGEEIDSYQEKTQ